MGATATALTWAAGLLVGFLLTTVLLLRREVTALKRRLVKLEAAAESLDARLFCIEQEQRWQASRLNELGENVSG